MMLSASAGVLLGIAAVGGLHLLEPESALAHLGQRVFDCGPLDQKSWPNL